MKDLVIKNEVFHTIEDYKHLADRVWIHTSLGGKVYIVDCVCRHEFLTPGFRCQLNEMVGFKLFAETTGFPPLDIPKNQFK